MLKPNGPVTRNLITARELIRESWSEPPTPTSYCIVTAISKVVGNDRFVRSVEYQLLWEAAEELGEHPVSVNYQGRKAALACYDRAIELSFQEAEV